MPHSAPEFVAARTVLLDALEALGSQRDAVVIVGAQAVYLRSGERSIIGVAPYTTDADLALAPTRLAAEPLVERLLRDAGFEQSGNPGVWWKTVDIAGSPVGVEVDIMVPDRYAPPGGRRSVRLPPHDKLLARRAIGLEGAMIDHDAMAVASLDSSDPRHFTVRVAGPAALVVAKVYKIRDRIADGKVDRIADKDAADVYRLMLDVRVNGFVHRLRPLLEDTTAGSVCREGVELLETLFGARRAKGTLMAIDALRMAVPPDRVADVCVGFVRQVRAELNRH